ncbi:MAG: YdhR family protein [Burkholderiaceae bacterium]|nr:YdhR family protein [Burkholderiaceae bacterium]
MIVSIVTFKLPEIWTVAQAAEVFRSTAPKYLGRPGLVRKHYYLSESGDRAGGIYFWESKAAAEACYTPEWKATVTEKYGSPPDVFYVDVPVTVDNVASTIEST